MVLIGKLNTLLTIFLRSPSYNNSGLNRQASLEDERMRRFSKIGAAQIFPGFDSSRTNIFSNIINHQNARHIGISKKSSIDQLRWKHQNLENKGFPTRHAETHRRGKVQVVMKTRPAEKKYDLAERLRSRQLKTLGYESDESKGSRHTQRKEVKLRRKKVILDDSDGSDDREVDVNKATRQNTIAASTTYLTAATGNRNTVINVRSSHSRISSEGSNE